MAVTPDLNQIAIVMSQLQHNYSQLAQNWFDIFYNPTPKDISLSFFDELGNLEVYESIPNRAKDFNHIKNGEGSPEGSVIATAGTVYQDLTNGEGYIKKTGSSSTGWVKFISETDLDSIIRKGNSIPEGNITGAKGDIYVDRTYANVYIKTTATGNTGWVQINSSFPDQTGHSGKFLKTNGTYASWEAVDALPSQTGQNGKYLRTNGNSVTWETVDALPSQAGQSGKFLTTDGTYASWSNMTNTYHPTLFTHQWSDCLKNDVQWLRADNYSWNDGTLYEAAFNHLLTDIYTVVKTISDGTTTYAREATSDVSGAVASYAWKYGSTVVYTILETPAAGDSAYITSLGTTASFTIATVSRNLTEKVSPQTETVGEYSVVFYRATDGHKICLASQATVVNNIFNATGIAWYYVLDTTNDQFKLPRCKYKYWKNANILNTKFNSSSTVSQDSLSTISFYNSSGNKLSANTQKNVQMTNTGNLTISDNAYGTPSVTPYLSAYTDISNANEETGFYLYFYVGSYTQTAIEQTAGLNTELFNEKLDIDLSNFPKTYLKTTYVNGTSGYRIWSDGYCEQWGQSLSTVVNSNVLISLSKTYANTNYNIITCGISPNGTWTKGGAIYIHIANTDNFSYHISTFDDTTGPSGIYWKTSGYLASGQY